MKSDWDDARAAIAVFDGCPDFDAADGCTCERCPLEDKCAKWEHIHLTSAGSVAGMLTTIIRDMLEELDDCDA